MRTQTYMLRPRIGHNIGKVTQNIPTQTPLRAGGIWSSWPALVLALRWTCQLHVVCPIFPHAVTQGKQNFWWNLGLRIKTTLQQTTNIVNSCDTKVNYIYLCSTKAYIPLQCKTPRVGGSRWAKPQFSVEYGLYIGLFIMTKFHCRLPR